MPHVCYVRPHIDLTGSFARCWSLKALAARFGEIRVAQLNAESRELASTTETNCFDQRVLELEEI
jgi:hypothetical protein